MNWNSVVVFALRRNEFAMPKFISNKIKVRFCYSYNIPNQISILNIYCSRLYTSTAYKFIENYERLLKEHDTNWNTIN